jgi:hypothetical protein
MGRTDAGTAHLVMCPNISSASLLNQCGKALAAASGDTGPTVQAMVDIGRMGQRLLPDSTLLPSSPGYERGRAALRQLARFMGEHARLFRKSMRLVETFAPKTLDLFLKQKSRAGHLITYAHVRVIMRVDAEGQRDELVHYYYRHSPSIDKFRAEANKLLGSRRRESSRRRQFDAAVFRVIVTAQTMKTNLEGQAFLFRPLRDWADGKGTLDMYELHQAAHVHRKLVALQSKINCAVAILAKATQALEERQDMAADSAEVVGSSPL